MLIPFRHQSPLLISSVNCSSAPKFPAVKSLASLWASCTVWASADQEYFLGKRWAQVDSGAGFPLGRGSSPDHKVMHVHSGQRLLVYEHRALWSIVCDSEPAARDTMHQAQVWRGSWSAVPPHPTLQDYSIFLTLDITEKFKPMAYCFMIHNSK